VVATPLLSQSVKDYLLEFGADESDNIVQLPADDRFLSHFLAVTKWVTVIKGFVISDLLWLITLPDKNDALLPLRSTTREYISHIGDLLPKVSDNFLGLFAWNNE
jgi:hypothetical protein